MNSESAENAAPAAVEELHDVEVKLIVPADLAKAARENLKLSTLVPGQAVVCFFDCFAGSAKPRLQAARVILRARQKGAGKKGNTIVKLTYPDAASAAADTVDAPLEEDWVGKGPSEVRPSRSVERGEKLPTGFVAALAAGEHGLDDAFDEAQRKLVEARAGALDWGAVTCCGPVAALIWEDLALPTPSGSLPMTVEDWTMTKPGPATLQILEVSAKREQLTARQRDAFLEEFFTAAAEFCLGKPSGRSKTSEVLNFFAPAAPDTAPPP